MSAAGVAAGVSPAGLNAANIRRRASLERTTEFVFAADTVAPTPPQDLTRCSKYMATCFSRGPPRFPFAADTTAPTPPHLRIVQDHLCRRLVDLELITHFLDLRCLPFQACRENFHSLLLLGDERFLLRHRRF